jgi:hypothetical protein
MTSSAPSLSWKGLGHGAEFVLSVLEPAALVQSREFETGELAFWDEEKSQPKMAAVLKVQVVKGPHSEGEERSIWAQKPSNLFQAIASAQQASGAVIAPGGTLTIRFLDEKAHKNKRFNAIKIYEAVYKPPQSKPNAFAEEVIARTQPERVERVGWPSKPANNALPTW